MNNIKLRPRAAVENSFHGASCQSQKSSCQSQMSSCQSQKSSCQLHRKWMKDSRDYVNCDEELYEVLEEEVTSAGYIYPVQGQNEAAPYEELYCYATGTDLSCDSETITLRPRGHQMVFPPPPREMETASSTWPKLLYENVADAVVDLSDEYSSTEPKQLLDEFGSIQLKEIQPAYENVPDFCVDLSAKQLNDETVKSETFPKTTTSIILDHNELSEVPKGVCLPNVQMLSVSSQASTKRSSFSRCMALTSIPDEISHMESLTELSLNNNAIESLPYACAQLHNLRILNLNSNCLRNFPDVLCSMTSLTELLLSGNFIETLPNEIGNLQKLKVFRIGNNNLSSLPVEICNLHSLECLSIRNNQIRELPQPMYAMRVMCDVTAQGYGIYLEGNPLQYPPMKVVHQGIAQVVRYMRNSGSRPITGAVFPQTRVAHLTAVDLHPSCADLSNGLLSCLTLNPNGKQLPRNTSRIDASNNAMTHIDDSIRSLSALEELILDNNAFAEIPVAVLQHLTNLKLLSFRKQQGQLSLGDKTNRFASCRYQLLRMIPSTIYLCKNLKELYLSRNRIQEMAVEISFIEGLEVLEMTDNAIKSVPKEVCQHLKKLKHLGLSGNQIERLPSNIGEMRELRVLRLSNNNLQELPDSLCDLRSLLTLSLSYNRLVYLPPQFYQLKGLLPSTGGPQYYNKYLGRTFSASLRLEENEMTMEYPSRDVWSVNGSLHVERLFEYMKYVANNPHILQNEMRKVRSKLCNRPTAATTEQNGDFEYLKDRLLRRLSKEIGKDWQNLGIQLGLSADVLCHIEHDNVKDLQGAVFTMLVKWRNSKVAERGEWGLFDDLIHALGCPQVGRQDLHLSLAQVKQEYR